MVGLKGTYRITGGKLLFGGDYLAAALSSVESSFTTDNSLALGGATSSFAADFGNGVPVVSHDESECSVRC